MTVKIKYIDVDGDGPCAVVATGEHDRVIVINGKGMMRQPEWVREYLINRCLALADETPPGRLAEVIDLDEQRSRVKQSVDIEARPALPSRQVQADTQR